jgi:hypothetical protein
MPAIAVPIVTETASTIIKKCEQPMVRLIENIFIIQVPIGVYCGLSHPGFGDPLHCLGRHIESDGFWSVFSQPTGALTGKDVSDNGIRVVWVSEIGGKGSGWLQYFIVDFSFNAVRWGFAKVTDIEINEIIYIRSKVGFLDTYSEPTHITHNHKILCGIIAFRAMELYPVSTDIGPQLPLFGFSGGTDKITTVGGGLVHLAQLSIQSADLPLVKPMAFAVLNNSEDDDRRCENCVGADPNSSPKAYAVRACVAGGLAFVCGVGIFGKGYMRAGKSRYAGFMVCVGWIVQFVGVGSICLGIFALS